MLWHSGTADTSFMIMKMKNYFTLKALLLQWDFHRSEFVQKPPKVEMNKRLDSCTLISSSALFSQAVPTCRILCEEAMQLYDYWYIYSVVYSESQIMYYKEKYIIVRVLKIKLKIKMYYQLAYMSTWTISNYLKKLFF